MPPRRAPRSVAYKARFKALYSLAKVKIRQHLFLSLRILTAVAAMPLANPQRAPLRAAGLYYLFYAMLSRRPRPGIAQPIQIRLVTFLTQDPAYFPMHTRFQLRHIRRLFDCLQIPLNFVLDNGTWIGGEIGLMICLFLLASPHRLVDLEEICGREFTTLCRIRKWVIQYIHNQHVHRIKNYLQWHLQWILPSRTAIRRKKLRLSTQVPQQISWLSRNVSWIIDGFRVAASRPDDSNIGLNMQALLYSGFTGDHDLLWQNVVSPYGLLVDTYGPIGGANNDLVALQRSNILVRFQQACAAAGINPLEHDMGGDKIYLRLQNLVPLHRGLLNVQQRIDNIQDSQVRVSIEHFNGKVMNNWRSLSFPLGSKIQRSTVGQWVEVAMILTNAHTLLYGSQVHEYFQDPSNPLDLRMPTLESYFQRPAVPEPINYF